MSNQNEEFFTEADAYELLSECPQDSLPSVLEHLGYPQGTEKYPVDILDKVLEVYKSMGIAIERQKAIASSTKAEDIHLVVQEVSAIASELLESQDISIPAEVMMALAQARVLQSIELADKLSQLEERTLITRLGQNREQFTQKLLGLSNQHSEMIEAVLGEEAQSEFIQAAAPALPPTKDMVQAFLGGLDARQKAKRQISGTREQQRAALPPKKMDLKTVKAFLAARQ